MGERERGSTSRGEGGESIPTAALARWRRQRSLVREGDDDDEIGVGWEKD
jgi:hypothetical protein